MIQAMHNSKFWGVTILTLAVFGVFWLSFKWFNKSMDYFFFDPQDAFHRDPENHKFPLSAKTGTFEPLLKHYVGVTQLLITVAAASIAFGDSGQTPSAAVVVAKLLLAWSIFYGVLFCAVLLWRYDEYCQDKKSYTLNWYSDSLRVWVLELGLLYLWVSCVGLGPVLSESTTLTG